MATSPAPTIAAPTTPPRHLQWRYDHWVKHPDVLVPFERHVYVDVCDTSNGVSFSREELRQEDIPGLCGRSHTSPDGERWALRLLFTPRRWDADAMVIVPYSLPSIQALQSNWHVPTNYLPMFYPAIDSTASFSPIPTDSTWEGLLVVLPGGEFCTIVTTYNIATKQIYGICAGLSESNMNHVIDRLETLQGCTLHPLLVPVMLTTSAAHAIQSTMYNLELNYLTISNAMDCVKFYEYDLQYGEAPALTERPQRLTELTAKVAREAFATSAITHVLDHLDSLLGKLLDTYPCTVGIELQEEVVFMRQRIVNMEHCLHYIRDGVQSLVQLVYAMSQQEDNKLNHRYGADMRLITAITLIFLPGTFVATFFSSTFWDFAPSNTGSKVSSWVWIYWAVTIVLTLMVLVVWRFFNMLNQIMESVRISWRVASSSRKKFPRSREKRLDDEEVGEKIA